MSAEKVWTPAFRDLDANCQRVYFHVLTCSHRNSEGLFKLPKPYMVHDIGCSFADVDKGLRELQDRGYIRYDDATEVILDRKALTTFPPAGQKQLTGALRKFSAVPDSPLKADFLNLAFAACPELADMIVEAHPGLIDDSHPALLEHYRKGIDAPSIPRGRARQLEDEVETEVELPGPATEINTIGGRGR